MSEYYIFYLNVVFGFIFRTNSYFSKLVLKCKPYARRSILFQFIYGGGNKILLLFNAGRDNHGVLINILCLSTNLYI